MKPMKPHSICGVVRRAHALHRLARRKRWPAYVIAATAQDFPMVKEVQHDDLAVACVAHMVHVGLIILSLTLLE